METRDYSGLLPIEPPKGTMEWMKEQNCFSKEFLIYRAERYLDPLTEQMEKGVRITCTKCGYTAIEQYLSADCCRRGYAPAPFGFFNSAYKEDVISGRCTICPECGEKLEARHIGAMPGGILQEAWCMTIGRVEDKLTLLGWLFRRCIDKEGRSEYWTLPYEAYVVEEKKIVRLMGYQKCLSGVRLFGHWEQRKTYLDVWGLAPRIAPWDPVILEGTTAENCKLDRYLAAAGDSPFPVSYVRFWQKRKAVENLVVQGAGNLVAELIEKECSRYSYMRPRACPELKSVNWKEKRPAQMLGLNKDEFRVCIARKWKAADLEVYKKLRAEEPISLPEDMELVKKYGAEGVDSLMRSRFRRGQPVMRCLRYLEKQRRKQEKGGITLNAGYLMDYWSIASGLGEDLNDASVRFPKDLRRQHDRVAQRRAEVDAGRERERVAAEVLKRAPLFARHTEKLATYVWEKDGILIRPAADENELIYEGKFLSHCVARYGQSMAEGRTAIFFIRRAAEPDVPWFTLELNEKDLTVRQNRGKKNCDRTEEIREFENAWLLWLKEQRLSGKLDKKNKKEVHVA